MHFILECKVLPDIRNQPFRQEIYYRLKLIPLNYANWYRLWNLKHWKDQTLYHIIIMKKSVFLDCVLHVKSASFFVFLDIFNFIHMKNHVLILCLVPYVPIWYRFELNWSKILKCIWKFYTLNVHVLVVSKSIFQFYTKSIQVE